MNTGPSELAKSQTKSEQLAGGWTSTVWRDGDALKRSPQPWSASVISLLQHLDEQGFTGSPRPVGTGFDSDGNEALTFIPGESLQPDPWSDEGLAAVGSLLAELHRASASFVAPVDTAWQRWFGRELGDPSHGFGHGDLGPWNIMAIDGLPTGFIDWDTAGPLDPIWDLAQAAWLNVQLHDDDLADTLGLGDAKHRAARLASFLDAYQLARSDRIGFVDKMVEVVVRSAANEAIMHKIDSETATGVAPDGYPFAWGMAWRIRGARWMLENRTILQSAIN